MPGGFSRRTAILSYFEVFGQKPQKRVKKGQKWLNRGGPKKGSKNVIFRGTSPCSPFNLSPLTNFDMSLIRVGPKRGGSGPPPFLTPPGGTPPMGGSPPFCQTPPVSPHPPTIPPSLVIIAVRRENPPGTHYEIPWLNGLAPLACGRRQVYCFHIIFLYISTCI